MVKIDDVLHVFIGDCKDQFERKIQTSLSAGKTVELGDQTQWVECWPIRDNTKEGSAAYTWKGDSVRVERFLVTKTPTTFEKKLLGKSWRAAADVL
jgi:hypothetical protein